MNLQNRIKLLVQLGEYLHSNPEEWQWAKQRAFEKNGWFIPQFIDLATNNITTQFLQEDKLTNWANHYHLDNNVGGKNIGIVMAGNIPLVGFHDFLSVFITGHRQTIKLSSKDDILFPFLIDKITDWESDFKNYVSVAPMLKGCDAYIATGSNNSAMHFDYYFSKYPCIVRRNRSSVAILKGDETMDELKKLSSDIHSFFGLGCRNVTKIFVPKEYDFVPLLKSFEDYKYFSDHHKYKNNYDYYLTIQIMNNRFYMTNEHTLLTESESIFSPISQLNYSFYEDVDDLIKSLRESDEIQCIDGVDVPFGKAQSPGLMDYADGVDTVQFLLTL